MAKQKPQPTVWSCHLASRRGAQGCAPRKASAPHAWAFGGSWSVNARRLMAPECLSVWGRKGLEPWGVCTAFG